MVNKRGKISSNDESSNKTSIFEGSFKMQKNAEHNAEEFELNDKIDRNILEAINDFGSNKSFCIFRPDSGLHAAWEILGFLIIIYQSTIVPFEICFNVDTEGFIYYLEYWMDAYFLIDILVWFNTGIFIKGILVMKRSKKLCYIE